MGVTRLGHTTVYCTVTLISQPQNPCKYDPLKYCSYRNSWQTTLAT